jgi:hypothetical protein
MWLSNSESIFTVYYVLTGGERGSLCIFPPPPDYTFLAYKNVYVCIHVLYTTILRTCSNSVDAVYAPPERQWPLSGVHSIMMEKLVQPGEGGGARPPPFTISTITHKVVVYFPAEGEDTLPLFLFYPYMYDVNSIIPSLPPHVLCAANIPHLYPQYVLYCMSLQHYMQLYVHVLFLCVPVPSTILCTYSMSMPLAPMSTTHFCLRPFMH